jgi:hypothetical protein
MDLIPKEKAKELVDKMWIYALPNANGSWQNAKQCAIILVDELIETVSMCIPYLHESTYYEYWVNVKEEIIKL